jgi:2-keto-4-pentenoate hydratase/2-oxohepta-3-ene-1,7-dioic acid hydratase in catechol pathway
MKIARYRDDSAVRHAVDVGDGWHVATGEDVFTLEATDERVTLEDERLLAPLVPTDLLCIGLNYRAHAQETGSVVPDNPMLFIKSSNALAGPNDAVPLPTNSDRVDYEAELAVVIGRDCRNVSEEEAHGCVFGYTCANDVSARDWQKDRTLNGGQFARGKSFDRFCPLGPYLVTADEVADPNGLAITCGLNGEKVQQSTTGDMIFSVAKIIASLSETMTIRRGSVILTGTPAGVGVARTPPVFLKPGDVTEVEIERVGRLRTRFVREAN